MFHNPKENNISIDSKKTSTHMDLLLDSNNDFEAQSIIQLVLSNFM